LTISPMRFIAVRPHREKACRSRRSVETAPDKASSSL
jgi:hypothetical protein